MQRCEVGFNSGVKGLSFYKRKRLEVEEHGPAQTLETQLCISDLNDELPIRQFGLLSLSDRHAAWHYIGLIIQWALDLRTQFVPEGWS
jgi:hypothetical protein